MPFDAASRAALLTAAAPAYLDVIDTNIQREYPYMPWLVVNGPEPLPHHRALHPVFYGCFDWHSCVEMWWAAIRLLRMCADIDGTAIRNTMDRLLTPGAVEVERRFFEDVRFGGFERPYGWSWLLALQHELDGWDDVQGRQWAATLRPLALTIAGKLASWLPRLTYPQRHGLHPNTAFALARSFPFATARATNGDPALRHAIEAAAHRYYHDDRDYPAHYEPGGADFLSGALSEAELMSMVLPAREFQSGLASSLPGLLDGKPASLFQPVTVSDESDGQLAHLAGLNLSRAAGFLAIATALKHDEAAQPVLLAAAERHAAASLGAVTGSDYMEEHWLAAYAVLMLSS